MHLINATTLGLEEFGDPARAPRHAILSHTWGDNEVLFRDMQQQHPDSPEWMAKTGAPKVLGACRTALAYGLAYVWVDTCCIDKSSSAELSEAINSMFAWYQEAAVCFAYIEDMPPSASAADADAVVGYLRSSRWFTRGWTLRELLAPRRVRFFNKDWSFVGSKRRYASNISAFANIHLDALLASRPLSSFTVAQRMSWAADRQTTRVEDRAYSLFGIFDVKLPPIYGERAEAFLRLQHEIIQKTSDLTILLWDSLTDRDPAPASPRPYSLLAPSPDQFRQSADFSVSRLFRDAATVTAKGLHIDHTTLGLAGVAIPPPVGQLTLQPSIAGTTWLQQHGPEGASNNNSQGPVVLRYILLFANGARSNCSYGIYLVKTARYRFARDMSLPLAVVGNPPDVSTTHEREIILAMRQGWGSKNQVENGIYLPAVTNDNDGLNACTPNLDYITRVLYYPGRSPFTTLTIQTSVDGTVLDLLCVLSPDPLGGWRCYLGREDTHPRLFETLRHPLAEDTNLVLTRIQPPGDRTLRDFIDVEVRGRPYRITLRVVGPEIIPHISQDALLFRAELDDPRPLTYEERRESEYLGGPR